MDVHYTDKIVNTIKHLREDVYSTEEFKNSFTNSLYNTFSVSDVKFIPEKFGGWSVQCSSSESVTPTTDFMCSIVDCLSKCIHNIDPTVHLIEIGPNICNIIMMGSNGVSIKL